MASFMILWYFVTTEFLLYVKEMRIFTFFTLVDLSFSFFFFKLLLLVRGMNSNIILVHRRERVKSKIMGVFGSRPCVD